MKRYTKSMLRVCYLFPAVLLLFVAVQAKSISQSNSNSGEKSGNYQPVPQKTDYKEINYVVVGVFEFSDNAGRFMKSLARNGYQPDYFFYPPKQYYYVYVSQQGNFEDARQEVMALRDKAGFGESWVFNPHMIGYMGENQVAQPADVEWNAAKQPEVKAVEDELPAEQSTGEVEAIEEAAEKAQGMTALESMSATEMATTEPMVDSEVEGIFKVYADVNRAQDQIDIDTEVDMIDNVRTKAIGTLPAHEVNLVKDPQNGAKSLQLVAQPFGYRKMIHTINLDEPQTDENAEFVQVDGGVIFVNFPLERLKKDDKVIMYKVFFQNDAALLRSESKYELAALLDMMQENENYKIRLHGHTNGNSAGKIIRLGKDSNNFFHKDDTTVEGWGSAKQLSTERAETIKRYLIEHGIESKRIDVKGWGGKQMIYDKNSASAKKNIRVEVEVLED